MIVERTVASNRTHSRTLYRVRYQYESEIMGSDGNGDSFRTGCMAWTDQEDFVVGPWGPSGPAMVEAWNRARWPGRHQNFVIEPVADIDGEISPSHR